MLIQQNDPIIIISNVTKVTYESKKYVMAIYGYCRISTRKQNIERQIRNINSFYPTAHIIEETIKLAGVSRKYKNELKKGL